MRQAWFKELVIDGAFILSILRRFRLGSLQAVLTQDSNQ